MTSVAGTPSHMAPELLPELMSAMKAYDPTSTITAEPRDKTSVACTPKIDVYAYVMLRVGLWCSLELVCYCIYDPDTNARIQVRRCDVGSPGETESLEYDEATSISQSCHGRKTT